MTPSELMQAMADVGAPLEAIILAVKALDEKDAELRARDNQAAERKAADAARKREERAAKRQSTDSPRTVQGRNADTPSLEVSPQTPLPNPNPDKSPLSPPKSKGRKASRLDLPDWLPREPWEAFVAHRKAMRGIPFTDDAARGVIAKIDELRGQGHCPAKLLSKAVMHGWRTVFDGDDTKGASGKRELTAEDYDKIAEGHRRIGRTDDAAEAMRKAAALRSQYDPKITRLISGAGQAMRVGASHGR